MASRTPFSLYGRVHGVAAKGLYLLARSEWAKSVGLGVVSVFLRRTLVQLRAHPAVARVLIRGSYREERFIPLLSDIDIVVWLHGPGEPTFARLVEFLECLRAVRRRDPSLRDEWQFLIGEAEWPLLERHGGLLEMDRWCDERRWRPFPEVRPASPQRQRAHDWRRHNQWVETAMRFGLPAPGAPCDAVLFAACEKKARVLAGHLLGQDGPSHRSPPPRSREEFLERAASLLALRDRCASKVLAETGSPPLPTLPVATVRPSDTAVLAFARGIDGQVPLEAIVWQAGVVCLVTSAVLDDRGWLAMLRRIEDHAADLPARVLPYTRQVFALGSPLVPRRTVAVEPEVCSGSAEPFRPALLRAQLVSDALFVGAEFRILADRPVRAEGVPAVTEKLACLLAYFALEVFVPEGGGALEVLRRGGRVGEVPPSGSSPERWHPFNAELFSQLVKALEGEAR